MSDEGPWYIVFGPGKMTDEQWELWFWRDRLLFQLKVRSWHLLVADAMRLLRETCPLCSAPPDAPDDPLHRCSSCRRWAAK